MVLLRSGPLDNDNGRYKVYLNIDKQQRDKVKYYLRVTHISSNGTQNFRKGTYRSKEDALKALEKMDPKNPRKSKIKAGSIDLYSNGTWRVRAKYKSEIIHIGYYKSRELARENLNAVLQKPSYLQQRYENLMKKRARRAARVQKDGPDKEPGAKSKKRKRIEENVDRSVKKVKTEPVNAHTPIMRRSSPDSSPVTTPMTSQESDILKDRSWYPGTTFMLPTELPETELSIPDFNVSDFQTPIPFSNFSWTPPVNMQTPLTLNENLLGDLAPRSIGILTLNLDNISSSIFIPSYICSDSTHIAFNELKQLVLIQDRELYLNLVSRELGYWENMEARNIETLLIEKAKLPFTVTLFDNSPLRGIF